MTYRAVALLLVAGLLGGLAACQSTASAPEDGNGKQLTTGVVQREIRKGMSGAEVIEALGSPNIVTTDENGRETWVYERYAREARTSENGYFLVVVFGSSRSSETRQRTLTVVIKFDESKLVRDFGYHSTTF